LRRYIVEDMAGLSTGAAAFDQPIGRAVLVDNPKTVFKAPVL
jgi:hypothetical protein